MEPTINWQLAYLPNENPYLFEWHFFSKNVLYFNRYTAKLALVSSWVLYFIHGHSWTTFSITKWKIVPPSKFDRRKTLWIPAAFSYSRILIKNYYHPEPVMRIDRRDLPPRPEKIKERSSGAFRRRWLIAFAFPVHGTRFLLPLCDANYHRFQGPLNKSREGRESPEAELFSAASGPGARLNYPRARGAGVE